jgi:hypothetical protein
MLQDRSGVDQRQADGQFFELPGDTTVLQEPQGPVGGAQQSLQFGNKAQANPWPFHLGDSGMHSLRPPSRSGGAAMSFIPPKQANPWPYHGHENDSDRPASSDSAKEGENEQRGCTATETSYSPNASPDEGASLVLPTHEHPVVEDQEMRDVSLPVGTVDASLVPAPLKIPRPRSSSALPCESGYSNGYRDVVRPTHLNVRSDGGSEESYWRFPEKGSSPMEPAKDSCLAMTENAPYVSSPNASIDFVSANSESLPSSLPAMTFHGLQECSAQNIDSERPTASMGDATEYNSGEVVAQRRSAVALEDDSPHASSLVSKKAENLDTGGTMVDGYTPFSPTPGGQKLQYRHPTGLAHGAGNGSNPASEPRPPYPGSERAKLSDGLESRGGLDCTMSLEYQEHEQDMKRDDPQQGNRVSTGGLRPPPNCLPGRCLFHIFRWASTSNKRLHQYHFRRHQSDGVLLHYPVRRVIVCHYLQNYSAAHLQNDGWTKQIRLLKELWIRCFKGGQVVLSGRQTWRRYSQCPRADCSPLSHVASIRTTKNQYLAAQETAAGCETITAKPSWPGQLCSWSLVDS